jgi:hypothetical protein
MSTIASSFCKTVNYELGSRSINQILSSEEYHTEDESTKLVFDDGSTAIVDFQSGKPIAQEIPSFVAKPFVKISVGQNIVYTNGCDEIFIQSPSGDKTLRVSFSHDDRVNITGMGNLVRYDGFQAVFK